MASRDTNLSVLGLLGLSFGRAGIVARAGVSHHAHSLNLDFDPGSGEVRHGDEGAAGIVPILEEVSAHFHELVAVAGFLDEHGHVTTLSRLPPARFMMPSICAKT